MATVTAQQLTDVLAKRGLPHIICIFGDTPLLVDDSVQAIRAFAKSQGITERQRLVQDAQFDWSQISAAGASMSLFSEQRLLELELPDAKPGREGGDALRNYAEQPNIDQILVVLGPKLKQDQVKAKWYQLLTRDALLVTANAPDRAALPRFIDARARRYQLELDRDALSLLADWYEGNLLALDQELQKLALMGLSQPLTLETVRRSSQDQSRFSVFALQEALLHGHVDDALHRLHRLFEEDVEIAILNWMFQREWQTVSALQQAIQRGESIGQAARALPIWKNQEAAYQHTAQRLQGQQRAIIDLLKRLEFAFKRDSGEDYKTVAAHFVMLWCLPTRTTRLSLA
ncbi:MAG TPA: DNA polymerase III subunit delta [Pseudidiomarina sp.]|nr:DNA polymerase III subunit delta [Pseudidiomarina sp.]